MYLSATDSGLLFILADLQHRLELRYLDVCNEVNIVLCPSLGLSPGHCWGLDPMCPPCLKTLAMLLSE